ncbi:hypothetical protein [Vibrio rotiferianus]|uniref:hypothetical protein n=1 Tax=Vibrio rotiferianus TaxID=190895 RepID=UPI0002376E80|nr:hypothetical protein [Vibrio rotiferianus]
MEKKQIRKLVSEKDYSALIVWLEQEYSLNSNNASLCENISLQLIELLKFEAALESNSFEIKAREEFRVIKNEIELLLKRSNEKIKDIENFIISLKSITHGHSFLSRTDIFTKERSKDPINFIHDKDMNENLTLSDLEHFAEVIDSLLIADFCPVNEDEFKNIYWSNVSIRVKKDKVFELYSLLKSIKKVKNHTIETIELIKQAVELYDTLPRDRQLLMKDYEYKLVGDLESIYVECN